MPASTPRNVSEAAYDAWHRIVGVDLILKIDKTLVLCCDQRFKDTTHRHDAFADRDLAFLFREIGKVLGVNVEQARPAGVNRFDDISAGTNAVADIDAAAEPRVLSLYCLQDV